MAASPDPLAIYIHWPFCRSKCPYCDFNSHVRDAVDDDHFGRALLAELDHWAALSAGRPAASIFFGGGTPSLMPPDLAGRLIDRVRRHWPATDDIEITLEANPTTIEADRFAAFAAAGVNRVSIGVQSLNDDALRFLGRAHDAGQALRAVDLARAHFPRYSFDLIYALPGQSPGDWRAELTRALALAGDHLSLYTLTIEPGTAFAGQVARKVFTPLDPSAVADQYEAANDLLAAAGLPAYEISNHARPGGESRHNLVYWTYGDYLGIGAGAHGRLRDAQGIRRATRNWRKPETWAEAVGRTGCGVEETEVIAAPTAALEALMMGLRLSAGIDAARFQAATGVALTDTIDPAAVAELGDFIRYDGRTLTATPAGRRVLDDLLARIAR